MKFLPVRGFSFVLGVGESDEPILSRMMCIMMVKNSETFLADYEKFVASYNEIVKKVDSPVFKPLEIEKTDVDGTAALKLTTHPAEDAQSDAPAGQDIGRYVRARWQDYGLDSALRRTRSSSATWTGSRWGR